MVYLAIVCVKNCVAQVNRPIYSASANGEALISKITTKEAV